MEQARPTLLIAMPQLQDPNFVKSVLLLVAHKTEGAVGFVLNRPGSSTLTDLVSVDGIDIPPALPSWYGGPVETSTGIILHGGSHPTDEDDLVFDGMSLSSSEDTLVHLLNEQDRSHANLYPFRFLVGYAGWGPGQLDDEMQQGTWIQIPATRELVFDCPWQDLWQTAISSLGIEPSLLAPSQHSFLN